MFCHSINVFLAQCLSAGNDICVNVLFSPVEDSSIIGPCYQVIPKHTHTQCNNFTIVFIILKTMTIRDHSK